MTIENIDAQSIPATAFIRRSRVLESKDFKDALAVLPGIKAGKAVKIVLSDETRQMAENAGFVFKRHLAAHLKEAKLKLEVSLRKAPDGAPVIYVSSPAGK
jgi:hypothetical protein